jgi:hypothetical protein
MKRTTCTLSDLLSSPRPRTVTQGKATRVDIKSLNMQLSSDIVTCIHGQTCAGKSSALVVLGAELVKEGKKILHIATDMEETEVLTSYVANLVGETKRNLLNPNFPFDRLAYSALAYDGNLRVLMNPTLYSKNQTSLDLLLGAATDVIDEGFKADVIIIDGVDVISDGDYGSGAGRKEKLNSIVRQIYYHFRRLGIPVIVSSALMRDGDPSFDALAHCSLNLLCKSIFDTDIGSIVEVCNLATAELLFEFDVATNLVIQPRR